MAPINHSFRCGAVLAAMIMIAALPLQSLRAGSQDGSQSDQIVAELRAEYEVLSTKFARSAGSWRPIAPFVGSLLFVAPDEYTTRGDEGDQLRSTRDKYADQLFDIAKQAADAGQLSLAFQWATEALRENPDHADARRVLGYEKRDGKWLTPYGLRMADAGKEWHPKFGWVAPADVPRYEAGERPAGSRWVSIDEDVARHRHMKNGWQIRTDHFLVTTNHSLEAGVELAARLERLHQVWRQLFAGFYMTENEVRRLFAGDRPPRKQVRPFRVYYHRDKHEYVNALRSRQPRIAETLGIYFDDTREAHFFAEGDVATTLRAVPAGSAVAHKAGDGIAGSSPGEWAPPEEWSVATLYHEAVHQLFQETKPATRHIGELANFWIIEGVATYFETLREHNEPAAGLYFTIGDPDAGRLPAARGRLQDGFYIPLAELTRLGKADVQRHPDIAKLYGQASSLAAFFMDAQRGRYREPLVRYLDAVYSGRDKPASLAEATATSYTELDNQYRRFMESLP